MEALQKCCADHLLSTHWLLGEPASKIRPAVFTARPRTDGDFPRAIVLVAPPGKRPDRLRCPLEAAIRQPSSNVGLRWRANPDPSPGRGRGASARYEPGLSLTIRSIRHRRLQLSEHPSRDQHPDDLAVCCREADGDSIAPVDEFGTDKFANSDSRRDRPVLRHKWLPP
jgi:hypothetical protein